MIKSLKTQEGYIYSFIEYEQIDKQHILIKYIWVHESHQNNGCIPSLVREMIKDENTHNTDFVAWERGLKGKSIHWYPTHRILRHLFKLEA